MKGILSIYRLKNSFFLISFEKTNDLLILYNQLNKFGEHFKQVYSYPTNILSSYCIVFPDLLYIEQILKGFFTSTGRQKS